MSQFLLVGLVLLSLNAGRKLPLPEPVDVWRNFEPFRVLDQGFVTQEIDDRWYTRVWANEAPTDDCLKRIHSRDFKEAQHIPCSYMFLLSIRDSRKAALKDGEKWMAEASARVKSTHGKRSK